MATNEAYAVFTLCRCLLEFRQYIVFLEHSTCILNFVRLDFGSQVDGLVRVDLRWVCLKGNFSETDLYLLVDDLRSCEEVTIECEGPLLLEAFRFASS